MQEKISLFSDVKLNLKQEYSDEEFVIARMGFLSSCPNSHGLEISNDVLREYASSALGKWVVAKMNNGKTDATTHLPDEVIVGRIDKDQEVEFEEEDGGFVRAFVYVVLSKVYARDLCRIFESGESRAVSVEMRVYTDDPEETHVCAFNIEGVTVLGKDYRPSCPNSSIKKVLFKEKGAHEFYHRMKNNLNSDVKKFVESRKQLEEKKTYKVDKSKDAVSTKSWGDVDKTKLRNIVMDAANRNGLVKDVYLLVEDGWEDAPSEHLKYPVMCLEGDTFVYNLEGLRYASGYAEKENEEAVLSKLRSIYKALDLDNEGEKKKLAELNMRFAVLNIGELWSNIWAKLRERAMYDRFDVEGIYEEDNQKFVVLVDKDRKLYRVDFTFTQEDGLVLADTIIEVDLEFTKTDNVYKFATPDFRAFEEIEGRRAWSKVIKEVQDHEGRGAYVDSVYDDHIIYTKDDVRYRVDAKVDVGDDDDIVDVKIDWDTVKKDANQKMAELEAQLSERDNIIMEQNAKIAELEAFKDTCMNRDKMARIDAVLSSISAYMSKDELESAKTQGMECKFEEIDLWANKVKAGVVDKLGSPKMRSEFMRIANPMAEGNEDFSVWNRI